MLKKKCIFMLFLLILFTSLCFHQVNAVHGFGNYVIDSSNGEIQVIVNTGGDMEDDQKYWKNTFDDLMAQYGRTITWITGIATITLVIVFIYLCVKGAFVASEHWFLKRQTMFALLWVGIGAALMGSATLILLIFQNAFV